MTRLGIGAGLAAALALGVAAVSPAQTEPAASSFALAFSSPRMTFIDEAPRGESIGDTAVDRYVVREVGGEGRSGFAVNHCVFAGGGKRPVGLCHGTVSLADGTLSVQGVSGTSEVTRFAVTGGTGRYAGVTGAIASERKGRTLRVTVELR